jgi:excisionase family DNA binding protein
LSDGTIVGLSDGLTKSRNMTHEDDRLLTVAEVAERLRQSEFTVRQKVGRGELPGVRVGVGPRGPIRIREADLQKFGYGPEDTHAAS